MEVAGVGFRSLPCLDESRHSHPFPAKSHGLGCDKYSNKGRLQYSNNGPKPKTVMMTMKEMESKKKETKKKLKLLKGLSKNLSNFSDMGFGLNPDHGLDQQVKGRMISEATEVLLGQLHKVREEKLELKRKKKEEKAKKKAARMEPCSSCSSSECEKAQVKPNVGESLALAQVVEDVSSKKIEVCMGGKCKKSGGALLLENFERAVGGEATVVGCKCMGKCRDGPNVRVRGNGNPLCVGVGLEDVEAIVTNFLGSVPQPSLSNV